MDHLVAMPESFEVMDLGTLNEKEVHKVQVVPNLFCGEHPIKSENKLLHSNKKVIFICEINQNKKRILMSSHVKKIYAIKNLNKLDIYYKFSYTF
jgi:hypothetical protein